MMKRLLAALLLPWIAACAASRTDDAAFERRMADESYCVHSAHAAQLERAAAYRSAYLQCMASRHEPAKPQDVAASAR
ncbi:MAG TPA: hypothetical protein VFB08_21285 [Burkholderiales bacterium]|nr:hypothetical protein [Burkholderiales bacterium]